MPTGPEGLSMRSTRPKTAMRFSSVELGSYIYMKF